MTTKQIDTLRTPATFIGNRPAHVLDLVGPDRKSLRQKYLIGEPCSCPSGTAEEMKRRGYVGIYLKTPAQLFRLPHSGKIIQKTW
jgi:hypothetical protein